MIVPKTVRLLLCTQQAKKYIRERRKPTCLQEVRALSTISGTVKQNYD